MAETMAVSREEPEEDVEDVEMDGEDRERCSEGGGVASDAALARRWPSRDLGRCHHELLAVGDETASDMVMVGGKSKTQVQESHRY